VRFVTYAVIRNKDTRGRSIHSCTISHRNVKKLISYNQKQKIGAWSVTTCDWMKKWRKCASSLRDLGLLQMLENTLRKVQATWKYINENYLSLYQNAITPVNCNYVEKQPSPKYFTQLKNERPTWCHLVFYFTPYVLNMFRTLIYPSSRAWGYSVELPRWSYCSWFDVCWSFSVVGLEWYPCCRLKHPATRIPLQPNHTETPTHIETRTHNQFGDTIEKSQAPDDGYINVRKMLST